MTGGDVGARSGDEVEGADAGEDVEDADAGADVEDDVAGADAGEAGDAEAVEDVEDADAGAEVADDVAGADGGDEGAERGRLRGRPAAWRQPKLVAAAVVAVVALSLGAVLAFAGRDDGDGGAATPEPIPSLPSTTIDTGGIEVPLPEGWTAAPVPQLGFGIGVPPGWEAVVLSDEMLASLPRSSPRVTGFVAAAQAAADAGAVFYEAGEDQQGRVSDVKVRAATQTGVTDLAGLRAYADALAADPDLTGPTVTVVDGAERPTVRIRSTTSATGPEGDTVTSQVTETLVLGPRHVVWSVIVTNEVPEAHDRLAADVVSTLTFAPDAG